MFEAGGFPLEIPVAALAETFQKPTPMMYRNLLAMEVEELRRSYPTDGAVLMGGCDKTTPCLLMGAIFAGQPAIYLPAGPMLRGNYRARPSAAAPPVEVLGRRRAGIGECQWPTSNRHRPVAGPLHDQRHRLHHDLPGRGAGHDVPGAASIPAVLSAHSRMAVATGRADRRDGLGRPAAGAILTPEAFENAPSP